MTQPLPRLIVGLGNPGSQYEATRHNIGFMVIDRLLEKHAAGAAADHVAESLVWSIRARGRQIWLQKPLTFMNLSGRAAGPIARREGLEPSEVLVIYDDADLPLGRLRLRGKGSSGGHNGIESLIMELASADFLRLRLGIGKSDYQGRLVEHVLAPFEREEESLLSQVIDAAAEAAMLCVHRGLTAAMNTYNGLDLGESTENDQRGESVV